jgi:uncharacterized protein (TIGR02611 family)
MRQVLRRPPMDHVRVVRERIRSRRTSRAVYRFVVALLGVAITLGGLLLVPLPGPGWLIVLAGLALLATEFEPARRLLEFARRTLLGWTVWLGRQGVAVRAGVGLGTLACVAAGLWGAAVVAGVPGWVPDGVVPPLPGLRR